MAARAVGQTPLKILFRHLLPNALTPIVVRATLMVGNLILLESSLSFLGLGIQPPLADWGSMVAELARFIAYAQFDLLSASLPLMAAGAIALLTVGVNFVVDWMLHRSSGLKE